MSLTLRRPAPVDQAVLNESPERMGFRSGLVVDAPRDQLVEYDLLPGMWMAPADFWVGLEETLKEFVRRAAPLAKGPLAAATPPETTCGRRRLNERRRREREAQIAQG